jgi:septal ring factor EnvC (AmiA/AmiB activator)
LNGFGLLVVLDHGGGYMSLYGHNEEVYRKVGDVVAPGDPIGALAERGADDQAALYVEIRRASNRSTRGYGLRSKRLRNRDTVHLAHRPRMR